MKELLFFFFSKLESSTCILLYCPEDWLTEDEPDSSELRNSCWMLGISRASLAWGLAFLRFCCPLLMMFSTLACEFFLRISSIKGTLGWSRTLWPDCTGSFSTDSLMLGNCEFFRAPTGTCWLAPEPTICWVMWCNWKLFDFCFEITPSGLLWSDLVLGLATRFWLPGLCEWGWGEEVSVRC